MAGPTFERPAERLVKFADGTIRYLGGLHTIWNGSDIQDDPDTGPSSNAVHRIASPPVRVTTPSTATAATTSSRPAPVTTT